MARFFFRVLLFFFPPFSSSELDFKPVPLISYMLLAQIRSKCREKKAYSSSNLLNFRHTQREKTAFLIS